MTQPNIHRSWRIWEQTCNYRSKSQRMYILRWMYMVSMDLASFSRAKPVTAAPNTALLLLDSKVVCQEHRPALWQMSDQKLLRYSRTVHNDLLQDLITLNALLWQREVIRETSRACLPTETPELVTAVSNKFHLRLQKMTSCQRLFRDIVENESFGSASSPLHEHKEISARKPSRDLCLGSTPLGHVQHGSGDSLECCRTSRHVFLKGIFQL